MTWTITPRQFHNSDYEACIRIIRNIYGLYKDSLKKVVTSVAIQKLFGEDIEEVRWVLSSGKLATILSYSLHATTTIIGIVARVKGHPDTGIIAFRGTQLVTEWLQNADFLTQINLSQPQPSHPYSSVKPQPLTEWNPHFCLPNAAIARGFYTVYTSFTGRVVRDAQSLCYCAEKCKTRRSKAYCRLAPASNISKIDKPCKKRGKVECSKEPTTPAQYYGPSIQDAILHHVQDFESMGVKRWLVTGHSLGGALATVTSYHLAKLGHSIYGVYTIACPRVGNPTFARDYNNTVPYHYRSANLDDLVTQLPLPNFGTSLCYTHVGNAQFVFSDLSMARAICEDTKTKKTLLEEIHSCKLYANRSFRTKRMIKE